jgi:DNA-3-methyladenine glycosylase II
MTTHIHTEADLDTALNGLIAADPRLAAVLATAGRPPLRRREGGFAGLAAIVCAQQLSTASAGAIWGRLTKLSEPFDHATVMRARGDRLRRVGLSAPKIRTLKAIAKAVHAGDIDLATLADMPADTAHERLTRLHGIGPWTADIYLLSCLGHADAWPGGDLALQEAMRMAFAMKRRPTTKEMGPLADIWRPWRAVAARLLWTYYRAVKGRDGAPVPTTAAGTPVTAKSNRPKTTRTKTRRTKPDKPTRQPAKARRR